MSYTDPVGGVAIRNEASCTGQRDITVGDQATYTEQIAIVRSECNLTAKIALHNAITRESLEHSLGSFRAQSYATGWMRLRKRQTHSIL